MSNTISNKRKRESTCDSQDNFSITSPVWVIRFLPHPNAFYNTYGSRIFISTLADPVEALTDFFRKVDSLYNALFELGLRHHTMCCVLNIGMDEYLSRERRPGTSLSWKEASDLVENNIEKVGKFIFNLCKNVNGKYDLIQHNAMLSIQQMNSDKPYEV